MSYVDSSKIKIFPFGSLRAHDPYRRALTEETLTNMIKNMTDKDSYVISYVGTTISFCIEGYFFEADISGVKEPDLPLFASIEIQETNSGKILVGKDAGSTALDVVLTNKENNTYTVSGTGSETITLRNEDPTIPAEFIFTRTLANNHYIKVTVSGNGRIERATLNGDSIYGEDDYSKTEGTFKGEGDLEIVIQVEADSSATVSLATNDSQFEGCTFSTDTDTAKQHCLQLLDESGSVFPESYIKFDLKSIGLDNIYGGTASVLDKS